MVELRRETVFSICALPRSEKKMTVSQRRGWEIVLSTIVFKRETDGKGIQAGGWVCPRVSEEPWGWGARGRRPCLEGAVRCQQGGSGKLFLLDECTLPPPPPGTWPRRKSRLCELQARAHSDSTRDFRALTICLAQS